MKYIVRWPKKVDAFQFSPEIWHRIKAAKFPPEHAALGYKRIVKEDDAFWLVTDDSVQYLRESDYVITEWGGKTYKMDAPTFEGMYKQA